MVHVDNDKHTKTEVSLITRQHGREVLNTKHVYMVPLLFISKSIKVTFNKQYKLICTQNRYKKRGAYIPLGHLVKTAYLDPSTDETVSLKQLNHAIKLLQYIIEEQVM